MGTYMRCKHLCDDDVRVIDVKTIRSVVMMAPDPHFNADVDQWFVMGKFGLNTSSHTGINELHKEGGEGGPTAA